MKLSLILKIFILLFTTHARSQEVLRQLQEHNSREYQLLENQLEMFDIEQEKSYQTNIFDDLKDKKPIHRILPKRVVIYDYDKKEYFENKKKIYVMTWYLDFNKKLCYFKGENKVNYTLLCSDLEKIYPVTKLDPVPEKYVPFEYRDMESYTDYDQYPIPKLGFTFSSGTNYGTYTKDILGEENNLTAPFQKYQILAMLNSKANFIFGLLAEHQRDTFYLSRAGRGYLWANSLGIYLEGKPIPFYNRHISLSTELTWGDIEMLETHKGERVELDFIHNSMAINLNHLTAINKDWEYIMGLKFERKWKKMVKVKYFVKREDESIQDDLIGFFFGFRRKVNAF